MWADEVCVCDVGRRGAVVEGGEVEGALPYLDGLVHRANNELHIRVLLI